ncbi:MAG: hypothetical protein RL885_24910 [Planctomycetota bacterium]
MHDKRCDRCEHWWRFPSPETGSAQPKRLESRRQDGECRIRSVPGAWPKRRADEGCSEFELSGELEQAAPVQPVYLDAKRLGGPPIRVPVDADGVGWDPGEEA